MVICNSHGTYYHPTNFGKNQSIRSEPQNIQFTFHAITTTVPHQNRCYKLEILLNQLTLAILTLWWHEPLIVLVNISQIRVRNWNFRVNWAILNKYRNSAIGNVARLGCLKAFFVREQRNINTWLYVTLTRHITIRPILEKIKVSGANHKILSSHSMLQPLNYGARVDFPKQILLNELTLAVLTSWWHEPLIVLTISQILERNWNFRVIWAILKK